MSDQSIVRHLEQVGKLKLSEAIRLGCPFVEEHHLYSGCAIGTAYKAVTGRDLLRDWLDGDRDIHPERRVSALFNVPHEHVLHVCTQHFRELYTREQCADYLETQGY